MHILVTDRLACARCGPPFGLVLFADELRDRRVIQGVLGCSNCRERYPVEGGFGDLRPSPRPPFPDGEPDLSDDPEGAMKVAALLGVREGPGLLLLTGDSVRHAERLAAMVEGIEVVAAHPALRARPEAGGVSRLALGERFAFLSGSVRGAVLQGGEASAFLGEAMRILSPGARLVLLDPPETAKERLEKAGFDLLLEAETALVGARK